MLVFSIFEPEVENNSLYNGDSLILSTVERCNRHFCLTTFSLPFPVPLLSKFLTLSTMESFSEYDTSTMQTSLLVEWKQVSDTVVNGGRDVFLYFLSLLYTLDGVSLRSSDVLKRYGINPISQGHGSS